MIKSLASDVEIEIFCLEKNSKHSD